MVTGRLAQVLKLVARLDPGGELQKLSGEVLAERRDLEQQLQRRRTLEEQLREARGRLDEAREQQRAAEVEAAASRRRCAQMQDELVFVTREVKGVEEDLEALRSAVGEEAKKVPLPYTDPEEERRDVLTKVRAERELVMKDQKAIEELRTRLDEVFKQKLEAQSQQQALLERQRQCEQDRSLMLTAMEAERAKFMTMRADRLRVWQERADLEKQLQDLDQELLVSRQVPGRSVPAAKAREEQPNRRKGVPHEAAPPVVYGGASARSGVPRHWRVTPDPVLRPEAQPEPFGSSEGIAAPRRDNRGVRADA
ncbi:unnamed protein product [Effrenium voratum]|nr:unnamed protein product [Effrenium voratum]